MRSRPWIVPAVLLGLTACLDVEPPRSSRQASDSLGACSFAGGDLEGVSFTDEQASYALNLANRGTLDDLRAIDGIGARTAERIVATRPHQTLADLGAVPYVGPAILTALRADGDTRAILDWANHAERDALTAVCRVGAATAAAIEEARPIASLEDLAEVRYVGPTTLRYMTGADGYACATKGPVLDEWCGVDGARCWCADAEPEPEGFTLDEDAATGFAEEAAGTFYYDNADYVWEEHCESAYDHGLGYDQADVQAFCDRYTSERYFIASIQAALELAGTAYASEGAAQDAVVALVESVFFAGIDAWMAGFEAALVDFLGAP